jgi:hypothetical protein
LDAQARPGQLLLTAHPGDGSTTTATLRVQVEIHGQPPRIAFNPHYLADALGIAPALWLDDEQAPALCRHPGGRRCIVMPQRLPHHPTQAAA